MATRRVTMREAADILGVSKEAIRKRVIRGTLRSDMGEDGRRYVYLDADADEAPTHERDALISELKSHNATLREQLEAERDANRENRRIIAALTQRMPELEASSAQVQSSAAPSALRSSWEEGWKEATRRFVAGIAGVVVAFVSAPTAAISYFNNATNLAVLGALAAFFGGLTGLVGIYFGIKSASEASEGASRLAAEANATAGQAAQAAEKPSRVGAER